VFFHVIAGSALLLAARFLKLVKLLFGLNRHELWSHLGPEHTGSVFTKAAFLHSDIFYVGSGFGLVT
jgi:hypothetical protein